MLLEMGTLGEMIGSVLGYPGSVLGYPGSVLGYPGSVLARSVSAKARLERTTSVIKWWET